MFQILDVQQNTPEWLKLRRTHIGASDAPIIMGESPWSNPVKLYEEKLGVRESKFYSPAMQRGHDLEPIARELFTQRTSLIVPAKTIKSTIYPWMIASLDGLSEDGLNVVEIKCPNKVDHALAVRGSVPTKYKAQLQHQMVCAGVNKMYYCSFNGVEIAIVEVTLYEVYVARMLKKEEYFFHCMNTYEDAQVLHNQLLTM